jgi:KUP system potassium uptake protein
MSAEPGDRRVGALMLGALGVVYGDIGTSPLYAIRECFSGSHGVPADREHVLGVLSMIVWTVVVIVCVKYVTFVLRASNRGEGGILALLSLTFANAKDRSIKRRTMVALGVFGAALLYGDGMITPCITVLGALEGLEIATPMFSPYVVPLGVGVLIALFLFQHIGTGRVGAVFGPVMLLWFGALAALGVRGIVLAPEVLEALLPTHAISFVAENGVMAVVVLGTAFLAVTGAEALYADLGHFGRRPIQLAWFFVAFPALLLNYLGQGGLLLREPTANQNPFFLLAPGVLLYPLVALSVLASVIASQALIAGTFSITMQAIQLGYLPRLEIRHTSPDERGQIYLPQVNRLLLVGCIATCIGFGSSGALAGAYGIAVTLTMLITTVLFFFASRRVLGWPTWRAAMLCAAFFAIELVFFGANALKITHGGWFPLLVATALFLVMYTWKGGRRRLYERHAERMLAFDDFLESVRRDPPIRVPGTAVYMAGNPQGTPLALLHNLKHNKVLHEQVLLLTIVVTEDPHVPAEERVEYEKLPIGFHRMVARYGFMEQPRVPELLKLWKAEDVEFRLSETTFFLSRETIVPAKRRRMAYWRSVLFAFLQRNAQSATHFFGLPANRVVELGVQIEF